MKLKKLLGAVFGYIFTRNSHSTTKLRAGSPCSIAKRASAASSSTVQSSVVALNLHVPAQIAFTTASWQKPTAAAAPQICGS